MKKLFALMVGFMMIFAVAGNAMAQQESTVFLEQQAASHDYKSVAEGNNWAEAGASGWSYARQESEAKGLNYAWSGGDTDSENWSDVWAGVSDWGTTSHSWAGAQTYGETEAWGWALGDGYVSYTGEEIYTIGGSEVEFGRGYWIQNTTSDIKWFGGHAPDGATPGEGNMPLSQEGWTYLGTDREIYSQFSKSVVAVSGSIFQANYAGETGYNSGQFAEAGGISGADFKVVRYDVDKDRWDANTYASLGDNSCYWGYDRPYAYTWGDSYATIDATGNVRSASAWTYNGANTYPGSGQGTLDEYTSSVFGSGFAQALSAKGDTYAYGNADFTYSGNASYGSGQAGVNTNIVNNGNYSSASGSGYAYSGVGQGQ